MISFSVCTIKRPTFEKHYFYLLIYLSVEAAERELQSTESLAQVVDVAAHVGHARRQFQTPRRFGQQPVVQLEQPATEKKEDGVPVFSANSFHSSANGQDGPYAGQLLFHLLQTPVDAVVGASQDLAGVEEAIGLGHVLFPRQQKQNKTNRTRP